MTLPLLLAALAAAPSSHALVVTNNRSLDLGRPDLHYADDDGAQYAQLFAQTLGGEERVHLLTDFDVESRRLYPQLAARALPPTRAQLEQTVTQLAQTLAADKARGGGPVHLYLVFAGHGDVDAGQGFLELADGRLTASELEALVGRLPADRVHLVLDSCNAYFLLHPRKPGGRRWEAPARPGGGLLERHPHVGALISTSAEAVTYEWSELQSGIFSYEVRSGLRGAADVDGDGRVSYRELAAFIHTANAPVKNELYRPRVYARAPQGDADEALLQLPSTGRRLHLPATGGRRLTLRDAQGVRVLDVHKEDATRLSLFLPDALGTLGIFEEVRPAVASAEARPQVRYQSFPLGADLRLELAPSEPSPLVARGEAPVFRSLFEQPFGQQALASQGGEALVEQSAQSFGITQRDAERLGVHLESAADMARDQRILGGIAMLAVGAPFAVTGIALAHQGPPEARGALLATSIGGAALIGASSLASWLLPSDEERLLESFRQSDVSTESSRALAVLEAERRFEQHAQGMHSLRQVMAWVSGGVAGLGLAGTAWFALTPAESLDMSVQEQRTLVILNGGVSLGLLAQAIYLGFFYRYPLERAWDRYASDPDVREHRPKKDALQVDLTAGPMGQQGFGLGVVGRF